MASFSFRPPASWLLGALLPAFLFGLVGLLLFPTLPAQGQTPPSPGAAFPASRHLAAGPMLGHVTDTSARVWMLVRKTDHIDLKVWAEGQREPVQQRSWDTDTMFDHGPYHILLHTFGALKPATAYTLDVQLNGQPAGLQPFRTFPSGKGFDVSFLTGSCAMRPPQAFRMFYPGPQEAIYPVMQAMPSDFMLWLGDNIYYLLKHMNVPEQMLEIRIKQAQVPEIDAFLRSRPMVSIWDDHDFGPNNAKGNFPLKDTALYIHTHFWANPANGIPGTKGTFSQFSLSDADFFLLDNRFHSTPYSDPQPHMIGPEQMAWLKAQLLQSKGTFRFIAVGSQVLNLLDKGESWHRYPQERQELLDFIAEHRLKNVVFLTGDRHHTELQRVTLPGNLVVYDFTCSPLTSVTHPSVLTGPEADNPQRVPGTMLAVHNFGKVSVQGLAGARVCTIQVYDPEANLLWEHAISAQP
jgi:alkaline phosphatase D